VKDCELALPASPARAVTSGLRVAVILSSNSTSGHDAGVVENLSIALGVMMRKVLANDLSTTIDETRSSAELATLAFGRPLGS